MLGMFTIREYFLLFTRLSLRIPFEPMFKHVGFGLNTK